MTWYPKAPITKASPEAVAIKNQLGSPVIGVIGATSPNYEYSSEMGFMAGYAARQFLGDKNGHIFTGGVEGVGVDAFLGVATYALRKNEVPRFAAIIPNNVVDSPALKNYDMSQIDISQFYLPYKLPEAYTAPAEMLGVNVTTIYAGEEMSERREYVASVADCLIMLNGSNGTQDEALQAVRMGIPVIVVGYSGGAASLLAHKKLPGKYPLYQRQIRSAEAQLAEKERRKFIADKSIDMSKIYVVASPNEIESALKTLFSA